VPRVEVRVPRVVGGGGGGGTPVTSECRRLGWGQRGSGGGLAARWRCCRLGRGWPRGGGQGRRGGSPEEEEKQRGCRSSGQWVGPEDGGRQMGRRRPVTRSAYRATGRGLSRSFTEALWHLFFGKFNLPSYANLMEEGVLLAGSVSFHPLVIKRKRELILACSLPSGRMYGRKEIGGFFITRRAQSPSCLIGSWKNWCLMHERASCFLMVLVLKRNSVVLLSSL
jgi:hypothetical protein